MLNWDWLPFATLTVFHFELTEKHNSSSVRRSSTSGVEICIIICILFDIQFLWHEAKRRANLKKHRVDFIDIEHVITGPLFGFEDDLEDFGKQFWIALRLLGMRSIMITRTETEDGIRAIPKRAADKQ